MSLPTRLFALRPIAAALASASALMLAASQSVLAQTPSPAADVQQLIEAGRRAVDRETLQWALEAAAAVDAPGSLF